MNELDWLLEEMAEDAKIWNEEIIEEECFEEGYTPLTEERDLRLELSEEELEDYLNQLDAEEDCDDDETVPDELYSSWRMLFQFNEPVSMEEEPVAI